MSRVAKLLSVVVLIAVAASCSSKFGTRVPAAFDLYRTAKQDCGGPHTCRISFTLNVAGVDNPGTNLFRCDVRALDGDGAVVARGKLRAVLGTVAMVPTQRASLSPKVRQTVVGIEGTCVGLDPEGGD